MGYFTNATEKLALPSDPRNEGWTKESEESIPGYFVEIKGRLLFGDTQYRNQKVVQVEGKGLNVSDAVSKYELSAFAQATLERGIVAWNLDDDAGAVLPVNSANIRLLNDTDAGYIVQSINERNPQRTTEGKEPAS